LHYYHHTKKLLSFYLCDAELEKLSIGDDSLGAKWVGRIV